MSCRDEKSRVENHMRTMKGKYQDMTKIMALSVVGWNDDIKMIVLEDEAYHTYVEPFPKAKKLQNKHIPHYDDLQLVCGDDHVAGEFAQMIYHHFGGKNNEVKGDNIDVGDGMQIEPSANNNNNNEAEVVRTSTTNHGPKRRRGSRVSSEGTSMNTIGNKFERLAISINNDKNWKEKMNDFLWSMKGYHDDDMEMVYKTVRVDNDLV